ncbi:MAG: ATP-binding cassette domain-containing protein [Gammaproteobacteria bacterium]|nr:ATP-binding cassette domain-containing protein [Gammaproteobacteria bacterium]
MTISNPIVSVEQDAPNPPPIPAELLHPLLGQLQLKVKKGKLHQACALVAKSDSELPPVQQLQQILVAAQVKGVQTAQLRWRRFDQRKLPALLLHQGQWYRVDRHERDTPQLTSSDGERQTVADSDLEDAVVLWLRAPQQEREESLAQAGNPAAKLVWRALMEERGWVTSVLIATLLVNTLAIFTSLFAMQVYDRVVPTLAYATLTTLVIGMGIVITLDWSLKTLRARILDSASSAVDKKISQQVYDHVMHLQLDQYPRSLGTLAAQVGGLDSVRQFFSSGVVFALIDMPFALLFIAAIATIGGVVSLVYILLFPVALLLGAITQFRLRRLLKQQLMRINERQGLLVDSIRGAESIRANNATWRFSEQWQQITATIAGYTVRQKAISNLSTVTTGSLATTAYISAIVVGVGQIEAGNLTMGGLIACSILGGRIIAPVAQGVQYLAQWQNVAQSLQMVNSLLIIEPERKTTQNLLLPERPPEQLRLDQVHFSYPNSPITQLDIPELTLHAGERVLLLGPVGCGKSTLLKVLAGLFKPAEGRVRFGDADLWEIDPQIIANRLSYLPQSVHLFKGTLRSNLALSGAVSDSRLIEVAKILGIDTIAADNPQGMDLEISEGGEGLSGGQRQLVALGRVFLAQPNIWLLDEPTSSLDGDSETQVLQAIEQQLRAEDILLISTHRPALAAHLATRVIVMQQGRIVKDGPPEAVMPQLMANVRRQQGGNRLAPAAHYAPPAGQAGGAVSPI